MERQPGHDPGVIVPVKNYGKTSPKCSVLVILPPVPIKNTKTRCRPAQQMFLDDLAAGRLHMVSSVTVSGSLMTTPPGWQMTSPKYFEIASQ